MSVYIYGLKDPITKEIRYVGKTVNPKSRYQKHVKNDDMCNRHKKAWINSLKRTGHKPEMVILEETDEKHWDARERYWIKTGLESEWPLVNILSGGVYPSTPIVTKYDWSEIIWSYLPPDEWAKFKTLPEGVQLEICQKTSIKMMEYSWIAIKERGGDPKVEYNRDVEYWAGSDKARELVAVSG